MKNRKIINWLCLTGILGLFFYLLHDILGGYNYPDYDWMRQAVSDLTSMTSPSFIISRGLSTVYNLFACLSCVLVSIIIGNKRNKFTRIGVYIFTIMNWVSAIGYSLFPLSDSGFAGDISDVMHLVVTVAVVILSIISLILIIIGGVKNKTDTKLSVFASVALLCMFFGAIGVKIAPTQYFGLVERFGTYSAVSFNAILGIYGFNNFTNIK